MIHQENKTKKEILESLKIENPRTSKMITDTKNFKQSLQQNNVKNRWKLQHQKYHCSIQDNDIQNHQDSNKDDAKIKVF